MDDNKVIFSGSVKFVKSNRMGSNLWGNLSVRIMMDSKSFQFKGKDQFISEPAVWLSIKTTFLENGKLEGLSERVHDKCNEKGYILVTGAKFSDYLKASKDANGAVIPDGPKTTVYTLECGPGGVSFAQKPFQEINHTVVEGYVHTILDASSFEIKIPYRSKNETKYRKAIVYCDQDDLNQYKGKKLLLIGKTFGKTPDPSKKELVYMVCNNPVILQ